MDINLLDESYRVIDTQEKITIADSFVVRANKIGKGSGEAKLYIGHDSKELRVFYGTKFTVNCFLLKTDSLKYLDETKVEYLNPDQPYQNSQNLPQLWLARKSHIESLPNKIEFNLIEQTQIDGPRIYVKSDDPAYGIIRELSLPNISYLSVVKLETKEHNIIYYFKLFADYFGDVKHPFSEIKEQQEIELISNDKDREKATKARVGQGKYREELLAICPFCPITMVSDDRLLIASHIKPWAKSNSVEQLDPYNGFMLTPTFDYLFDRGFMSFTDEKKIMLSPFLSKMTYSKLKITAGKLIPMLPIEGRKHYLDYHRQFIFK